MFFDLSPFKLVALLIIATLVFGPDKLPEMILQVRDFIRKVRAFADSAEQKVREELGPEFKDFEFEDLNPRTFVTKHLLADDTLGLREIRNGLSLREEAEDLREAASTAAVGVDLSKSDSDRSGTPVAPRYDPDAT